MSKDPAFLFYSSDFLTGTMFMSNEQTGIYIKLLCAQHQHGGTIGKAEFNSMVNGDAVIRSKFTETESGFFNERLRDVIEKRALYTESRRKNRLSKPYDEEKKDISSSYVGHMSPHMENENENEDINTLNNKSIEKTSRFLEQHLLNQWGQREGRLNRARMGELVNLGVKYGYDKLFDAIEQSGRRGACNVAYVTAILEPKEQMSENQREGEKLKRLYAEREAKKHATG